MLQEERTFDYKYELARWHIFLPVFLVDMMAYPGDILLMYIYKSRNYQIIDQHNIFENMWATARFINLTPTSQFSVFQFFQLIKDI